MGQDLSVVLIDRTVHYAQLCGVIEESLPAANHEVAVVALGATPVTFPELAWPLPEFTAFSVWADGETAGRLSCVAAHLSAFLGRSCLVLTAADHACVGGWEFYLRGKLVKDQWCLGSEYLHIALSGLPLVTNTPVPDWPRVRDLGIVSLLAEPTVAYCLRSSHPALPAGRSLSAPQLTALLELDLPGPTAECLLGGAP